MTPPTRRREPRPGDSVELLAVGRVARAHGIRGEVVVQPLSEIRSRFSPGSVVLAGDAGERPLRVRSSRPLSHRLLVAFEGVADRSEAEELRGTLLLVPADTAPPLPEGEFWVHQVVGLHVLTESGRALGTVREVLHTAANDVWVVESEGRDVLIPALRDVVIGVELEDRRAVIREIPGLLEGE